MMYYKLYSTFVIVAALAALVHSAESPIAQCEGENFEGLADRIQVIPCSKTRCKLTKGTNTTVHFRFKPKEDVNSLVNDVSARLGNVPLELPFLGVTGKSACEQVTRADNGQPAPCPLKAGVEYVYTNVFFIEHYYPKSPLRVHWSLNDGNRKTICFEVPAAIVGN